MLCVQLYEIGISILLIRAFAAQLETPVIACIRYQVPASVFPPKPTKPSLRGRRIGAALSGWIKHWLVNWPAKPLYRPNVQIVVVNPSTGQILKWSRRSRMRGASQKELNYAILYLAYTMTCDGLPIDMSELYPPQTSQLTIHRPQMDGRFDDAKSRRGSQFLITLL